MLSIGERAPDFQLPNQEGKIVDLSKILKSKTLVLFFYPFDYNPVCTLEAIAFRNHYHFFETYGADVLGISSNGPESHAAFCSSLKLQFNLLADRKGKVRREYKVEPSGVIMPGRVTYVIDRGGIVRNQYRSQLRLNKHVKSALDTVEKLYKEF